MTKNTATARFTCYGGVLFGGNSKDVIENSYFCGIIEKKR